MGDSARLKQDMNAMKELFLSIVKRAKGKYAVTLGDVAVP
jgi:hypothetical protein